MLNLTEDQREFIEGVRDFLMEDFPRESFITMQGPPGSGKTYIAVQLSEIFKDKRFLYVAYTGKAVDNLTAKGVPAQTIYSAFYEVDQDAVDLKFNKKTYNDLALIYDVVVIDEVSMITQEMFEDICSFGLKVIAVGDRDQLGPVKGKLNTLLNIPDFELSTIHRQLEESGIIRLATEYSNTHELPPYGNYSDDVLIIRKDQVSIDLIMSSTQCICGTNKTRNSWNSLIRKTFNHYDYIPEPGERVISCKNMKSVMIGNRSIINGTTGICKSVKIKGNHTFLMEFQPVWSDQSVFLQVDDRNFLGQEPFMGRRNVGVFDFSYVITVNKAQGSEWDNVLFIVDKEIPGESLYRNINTGITRAKKKLIIAH